MRVSTWLQYDLCDFERPWDFSSCEESVKKPAGICSCLVRCWLLSWLPATQVSVGCGGHLATTGSGAARCRTATVRGALGWAAAGRAAAMLAAGA